MSSWKLNLLLCWLVLIRKTTPWQQLYSKAKRITLNRWQGRKRSFKTFKKTTIRSERLRWKKLVRRTRSLLKGTLKTSNVGSLDCRVNLPLGLMIQTSLLRALQKATSVLKTMKKANNRLKVLLQAIQLVKKHLKATKMGVQEQRSKKSCLKMIRENSRHKMCH